MKKSGIWESKEENIAKISHLAVLRPDNSVAYSHETMIAFPYVILYNVRSRYLGHFTVEE